MAEQLIRNEQVAGSIPVTSSKKVPILSVTFLNVILLRKFIFFIDN